MSKSQKTIKFQSIYSEGNWIEDAFVTYNQSGVITAIEKKFEGKHFTEIDGFFIPGIQNSHSHAFQFAIRGITEFSDPKYPNDSFWTWRESMYRVAKNLSPEDINSIAKMAFLQMLRKGYTHTVEFHYIHNTPTGELYSRVEEMSLAIIDAAIVTGIGLTLIPVYYGKSPLNQSITSAQKRFNIHDLSRYADLMQRIGKYTKDNAVILGHGVHSVRAAHLDEIKEIFESKNLSKGPKHIHISEQELEVQLFIHNYNRRPIEWILENFDQDSINLVHATHLSNFELKSLAASRHNVILCPTTEANLGDGLFPLPEFVKLSGKWCIGSDSQISICPFRELELADYAHRLKQRKRNPLLYRNKNNTGKIIFDQITESSPLATGQICSLKVGGNMTGLVVDTHHPHITNRETNHRLASIIFGHDPDMIIKTIVQGKENISHNRHEFEEEIRISFMKTLRKIFYTNF